MLDTLESGDDQMADVRDVMIQMRDGDGSVDTHYAVVQEKFGFASNATAKAMCARPEISFSPSCAGNWSY
jgi:hypothetical protein